MVVVIRLQGLRISAGSVDIRRFFTGLEIPAGGVHIIGGERGDAFIIFTLDEDARRAMIRSGGFIKGSPITLLLSSKTELQKELERSAKNMALEQQRPPVESAKRSERSPDPMLSMRLGSRSDYFSPPHSEMAPDMEDSGLSAPICLFLKGLPYSVTTEEIFDFFEGLLIDDVVLLKKRDGANNGQGLVKFATAEDAAEGLRRDKQYIGTRYIELSPVSTKDWYRLTGRVPPMPNMDNRYDRGRTPSQIPKIPPQRIRSRSPLRYPDPVNEEYCVLMENLSFAVTKEDVKQLFHHTNLEDDQILPLKDGNGQRTRSLFVLFKNKHDYHEALSQNNIEFYRRMISISPISREEMRNLMERQIMGGDSRGSHENQSDGQSSSYSSSDNVCVYVRNLPLDVRKVEIVDFFYQFNISEDEVCVLHDQRGCGVGKALVHFRSEAEAMRALSLSGRRFLGSVVMLMSISHAQMQELIADPPMADDFSPEDEQYVGRSNMGDFSGDFGNSGYRFDEDMPRGRGQDHNRRAFDDDFNGVNAGFRGDRGNGFQDRFDHPVRHYESSTLVQLVNLPFHVRSQEIYDFCHGYRVIPGSVLLQYDKSGRPRGSATVEFHSRQEAIAAISDLSGRPIGQRKIQLHLPYE